MLRGPLARAAGMTPARALLPSTRLSAARLSPLAAAQQSRQAHAISNPTLANIEKRWEEMPPQEQADLWMQLRDRMKAPWNELTLQEKKAAYWIAFGPHGPRAGTPPGENTKVFFYTIAGVVAAGLIFAGTRMFARGPPKTMTKEYQEASDAYLKESNVEPITGVSAEDWKGGFMVQSKPEKKQ